MSDFKLEDIVPELKLVNDMLEAKLDLPTVNQVEGLSNECKE